MARAESEKTSDRIQRKALEKAMAGETWGTGSRPFGYKKGGMEIEEREAIALREVVQRFLARRIGAYDESYEIKAVCDACLGKKSHSLEHLLPVVNSPRTGVCGYEGPG